MNRYIQQLIEIFAKAEANPVSVKKRLESYEDLEKHMQAIEERRTVSSEKLFGVSYEELPPVEILDKMQIQDLLIAIINALSAKGTSVDIPGNGVPDKIVYEEIREMFKDGFYEMPGWNIDFCSGNCEACNFAEYCDTCKKSWTKEELEKERKKWEDNE